MQKNNPGNLTAAQQTARTAAIARRGRRKAKRDATVLAKLRPLLVKMGQLEREIETLRKLVPPPVTGGEPTEAPNDGSEAV